MGGLDGRVAHVAGQVGQHRGNVLTLLHPTFDAGVGEVVTKVVRPRLLTAGGSGQPRLVPDAAEHRADRGRGDLVAAGGDEERPTRRELLA